VDALGHIPFVISIANAVVSKKDVVCNFLNASVKGWIFVKEKMKLMTQSTITAVLTEQTARTALMANHGHVVKENAM